MTRSSFDLWIWRVQYKYPHLLTVVRGAAWLMVLAGFIFAAFLALAVPDRGLLCR